MRQPYSMNRQELRAGQILFDGRLAGKQLNPKRINCATPVANPNDLDMCLRLCRICDRLLAAFLKKRPDVVKDLGSL